MLSGLIDGSEAERWVYDMIILAFWERALFFEIRRGVGVSNEIFMRCVGAA